MIKEQEVKLIEVHMMCDKCGIGKMLPANGSNARLPKQIRHRCAHCGFIDDYYVKYPYTYTKPVRNNREEEQ